MGSKQKTEELAAKKKAEEKRVKAQGKESHAKKEELASKEKKSKKYHKHWDKKNDVDELKNKALVEFNHNEKMRAEDVKTRADAMLKQIKSGKIPSSAPPENYRLIKKARTLQKGLDA